MKDLTQSNIERQNILNNSYALQNIQDHIGFPGMMFEGQFRYTRKQITEFYEIDDKTIDRYLENYQDELKHNGYEVIKGKNLRAFKSQFGHLLGVDVNRVAVLGLFNFRTFLNLGMLLVESENGKKLRSTILDIVIDTLNQKVGGNTKYINQRDDDFFYAILKEPNYRKDFTSALNECLEMGAYKYAFYTDKIYQAIFRENAKEYKRILQLEEKENVRDTMYSEVLELIASFETGLAHEIRKSSNNLKRKLLPEELNNLFEDFVSHPLWKPLVENARTKMASRDFGFRDVLHKNLENYLNCITHSDYERFLGEKSKALEERIEENIDVFNRLRDR
ncbi:DNA-binding protein [Larkinella sp. C7]|uniref:DNA-binding protein n=1 Tax=Larkinella sp. C7 TaxID=2576607 RepID=UPI0011114146|nr:DNA-binding protein [Larkinella sp. C7]